MRAVAKRKDNKIKTLILMVIMALVIITTIVISTMIVAGASENKSEIPAYKYYSSMTIKDHDTLWDIAGKYHGNNESTTEYLKNIKEMNNIKGDNITSGKDIVYYYYTNEYK